MTRSQPTFPGIVFPALIVFLIGTGLPCWTLAAETPDPLRLVPDVADLVVKVEQPRRIVDLVMGLAERPELAGFRGYRDAVNSTDLGRFQQMIAYVERDLGKPWPELVDHLAAGGIVFALKIDKQPKVLFVVQGDDPALTAKFFARLKEVGDEDRARLGGKGTYTQDAYRGVEVWQAQQDLYAAVFDATIVYANQPQAIKAAIDLHLDASKKNIANVTAFQEARKLLPDQPLAWAWLNVEYLKQSPEAKTLFEFPANFFPIPLTFGGLINTLYRSPYLVAAVNETPSGVAASIRFPVGTAGLHNAVRGHAPPPGEPGALPLLAPPGAIYANSYYLDFAQFWRTRKELLPSDQFPYAEQFDQGSAAFLAGTKFSELLERAGPRQRIVVTAPRQSPYTTQPATRYPNIAWVWQLRDPAGFEKPISNTLQTGAILAGFQAPMKKIEEQIGDAKLIGYQFLENEKNKARDNGILFNFSPCFARVKDQFIFSSSLELGRDLIPMLAKEAEEHEAGSDGTPAAQDSVQADLVHSRFHFSGLTKYLTAIKKSLVTQNMLEQGNGPDEAEREVSLYLNLLDHLGAVELSTTATADRYRIELRVFNDKDGPK